MQPSVTSSCSRFNSFVVVVACNFNLFVTVFAFTVKKKKISTSFSGSKTENCLLAEEWSTSILFEQVENFVKPCALRAFLTDRLTPSRELDH